jgi:hypothetical protein
VRVPEGCAQKINLTPIPAPNEDAHHEIVRMWMQAESENWEMHANVLDEEIRIQYYANFPWEVSVLET